MARTRIRSLPLSHLFLSSLTYRNLFLSGTRPTTMDRRLCSKRPRTAMPTSSRFYSAWERLRTKPRNVAKRLWTLRHTGATFLPSRSFSEQVRAAFDVWCVTVLVWSSVLIFVVYFLILGADRERCDTSWFSVEGGPWRHSDCSVADIIVCSVTATALGWVKG